MTRRRLHASFLAFGFLVVSASGLTAASCRPLEGPSGVHVSVALADGWMANDELDHITVTATSGSLRAVVCLSTVQGSASAFADAGFGDGGSDPCADRSDLAWVTVPTVSTWHLDQAARTVNFEFPEDSVVDLTAEAHLGGFPAIGRATAQATATIGGSDIDLRLARASGVTASCDSVMFGTAIGSDAQTAPICTATVKGCLCEKSDLSPADCLGAGTGLTCNDAGTHLAIDPANVPTTCPTNDVGRGIARPSSSCLLLSTTVRLYRQDDAGGVTADCTPPSASIVVRDPKSGQVTGSAPLSACVPPTVFGIPMTAKVMLDGGGGGLSFSWIGFDVAHTDDPNACKVDIDPVTFTDCGR